MKAKFKERFAPSIFPALASPKYQSDRYNVSKLLEILFIRSLAPAMTASQKPSVILNTLTPGFCRSELLRQATFPLNVASWVGKKLIARTTETGSRTLVEATRAGEETHGVYMVDCEVGEVSRWARSKEGLEAQGRVYEELKGILEGIEPGVTLNI